MIERIKKLLRLGPKVVRKELRLVRYSEAEKLLDMPGWRIAREEDFNLVFGYVWLERVEEAKP